jgi:hypothetical protein
LAIVAISFTEEHKEFTAKWDKFKAERKSNASGKGFFRRMFRL